MENACRSLKTSSKTLLSSLFALPLPKIEPMTISEFFGKFKCKMLWGNLLAMVGVIALLLVGIRFALAAYTHHGESIPIPKLVHKSFENAVATTDALKLNLQVSDTGYVKSLPPGYILEQFPAPGEQVKAGHVIYVTINATKSPTITLPDVIDNCSLREAMARLTAMGFKLGPVQFIPGEKDWVYGILVNGHHVSSGEKISVDARLIIQVGNGLRDASDSVDFVEPEFNEDEGGDIDEFEEVPAPEEQNGTQDQSPALEQ